MRDWYPDAEVLKERRTFSKRGGQFAELTATEEAEENRQQDYDWELARTVGEPGPQEVGE